MRWRTVTSVLTLTLIVGFSPGEAETIDPSATGARFAYSENAGWVNAEPLGNGGPGMHISSGPVSGWLWSESLGWISLSCVNTGSCPQVPYGVTNDGAVHLSGFAWSENAGWVVFSCATTASCTTVQYGVVADPQTGVLTGFAWSENVGWVSFSCATTGSCGTVPYGVETRVPFQPVEIFADDFESGTVAAWTTVSP
jgi:hypothetical protein